MRCSRFEIRLSPIRASFEWSSVVPPGCATFPIVENAFGFGNTPVSHLFIDHEEVHGELNSDDGETYSFTKT